LDRAGSKNYVKNTLMEVERGKKKKRGKKLIQKCIVVVKKTTKMKRKEKYWDGFE